MVLKPYIHRKACGIVKAKKIKDQVTNNPSQDDKEAVKLHLQELDKEHNQDSDIVVPDISCTEK